MSRLELLQQPALRLVDQLHIPIALVDGSGRLVHVNPALERFTGTPARRLVGLLAADQVPEDARERYRDHLAALRRDGFSLFRTWMRAPERVPEPVLLVAVALWGARGEWLGEAAAMLPDDAAELETALRITRAGTLARSVLREVAAGLQPGAEDAGEDEIARLYDSIPELALLTRREWAVARRLARGDRTPAIARELRIRPSTVRNHLKAVFRKTGTSTQAGLVARIRSWRSSRNGDA